MYSYINPHIISTRERSSTTRKAYYQQPSSSVVNFYSSSRIPYERIEDPLPQKSIEPKNTDKLSSAIIKIFRLEPEQRELEADMTKIGQGLNILV